MGVSAGGGMIHFVLLTRDDVGRNVVDSRVIDVDESDGLDTAGRVNAGIDLMLTAAREEGLRVGPIGVTARTGGQRRRLRSRGSGPKRQIRLVSEEEATVAYLRETGQIDRFDSVVVVDAGDTGMSLYTVEPASGRISDMERSDAMSGRQLDKELAEAMVVNDLGADAPRGRLRRSALLGACRTAKEEIDYTAADPGASAVTLAAGSGRLALTAAAVEAAAAPMVSRARKALHHYVSDVSTRGDAPEAVVLVGGLANIPVTRGIVGESPLEIISPQSPELIPATGAALLAQQTRVGATRLAFIGGKRDREWLSTTPLAVAGTILAATLMTIYAVSSSLTGRQVPEPIPSPTPTTVQTTSAATSMVATTTTNRTLSAVPLPTTDLPDPPATTPDQNWDQTPGWATTELPQTTSQSTTTRTLSPFPLPSLPFGDGSTPSLPPNLVPPGLLPSTTQTPPPPPVTPQRQAPTETRTPPSVVPESPDTRTPSTSPAH